MVHHHNQEDTRSLLAFFVLVFALALPFWLPGVFVDHLPLPFPLPASALQAVCPMLVTLLSREKRTGSIKRLFVWGVDAKIITRPIWYVPVLLFNPCLMALAYGVMLLLGRSLPAPSLPVLLVLPFFGSSCLRHSARRSVRWGMLRPACKRGGAR